MEQFCPIVRVPSLSFKKGRPPTGAMALPAKKAADRPERWAIFLKKYRIDRVYERFREKSKPSSSVNGRIAPKSWLTTSKMNRKEKTT